MALDGLALPMLLGLAEIEARFAAVHESGYGAQNRHGAMSDLSPLSVPKRRLITRTGRPQAGSGLLWCTNGTKDLSCEANATTRVHNNSR